MYVQAGNMTELMYRNYLRLIIINLLNCSYAQCLLLRLVRNRLVTIGGTFSNISKLLAELNILQSCDSTLIATLHFSSHFSGDPILGRHKIASG